jgi:hypothetical protein
MANELTLGFSLAYSDADGVTDTILASGVIDSLSTPIKVHDKILVATTPGTAIPLGQVSPIAWLIIKNLDATNFVTLYDALSGHGFGKIKPGKFCVVPAGPSLTAPVLVADTAAVRVEYLVC